MPWLTLNKQRELLERWTSLAHLAKSFGTRDYRAVNASTTLRILKKAGVDLTAISKEVLYDTRGVEELDGFL